jgi:DNA-binding HxlR family transcriptional regulator
MAVQATRKKGTGGRTYGDRCGVARALDLVGERWALLIVRELLLGPKRFTDLRAGLPHVSADVLAQRLRELEQAGILRRGTLPPPAGSRIYELTQRGRELEPVVLALGRWGSAAPVPPGEPRMSEDALVIALKTMFDPAAADGLEKRYELRLGRQRFRVDVADRHLEAARGPAEDADATIEADVGTLATVLWHGGAPGDLTTTGDARAVKRFLRLFRPPS